MSIVTDSDDDNDDDDDDDVDDDDDDGSFSSSNSKRRRSVKGKGKDKRGQRSSVGSSGGKSKHSSDGEVIVLIVDEVDYLLGTHDQSVVYKLTEWPGWPKAHLAIVGSFHLHLICYFFTISCFFL